MFFEDMCRDFSIEFTPISRHYDFFSISSSDKKLEVLLEERHDFIRYDFSRLLKDILFRLLIAKKAYVEVIKKFDGDNLIGISFYVLNIEKAKKKKDTFFFIGRNYNNERVNFNIHQDDVIEFVLKNVYKSSKLIIKILRKLSDIDNIDSLSLINKNVSYDFSEHHKRQELEMLKYTKDIFWLGRHYSNYYLNDFYILYRIANYKKLKLQFLEYLVTKINQNILMLGNKYNFEGSINYKTYTIQEIDKKIHDLNNGLCSIKEVNDFLFMRT